MACVFFSYSFSNFVAYFCHIFFIVMCVYLSNIHDILICYGIFDIIVDKYGNHSISFYTILMIFCLFCCHVVFKYILKAFGLKKNVKVSRF